MRRYSGLWACLLFVVNAASAADRSLDGNPMLAAYFEAEVSKIESQNSLFNYRTLDEWQAVRPKLRQRLFNMLGLNPLPDRTPLRPQVVGVAEEADFRVEKLHFQSSPGVYVTASLYLPLAIEQPLPTVLYVCGHALVKAGSVSFGNKVGYQHHGAWYARNGYACLTIDTLQLGEIEGIHHGTYKYNRWWWNAYGYTPAGVEAWNCIRALDYLETRAEVDKNRIGVTGRSGGGAYSWWIAALDDRIKCAVPVAGITTLRNHVVDGCVEGHCDCMFMVNLFQWDYATVTALVAPRPLLISNSDKDTIFPLEGVVEIHRQTRHIYELYGKPEHLGLQITEGPHKDTQELRVQAFRWLNRWLKNDDRLIDITATKFFEPQQLQVFTELPVDERNTSIDEEFVAIAAVPSEQQVIAMVKDRAEWARLIMLKLLAHVFTTWPDSTESPSVIAAGQLELRRDIGPAPIAGYRGEFTSEDHVSLKFDVLSSMEASGETTLNASLKNARSICLVVADADQWQHYALGFLDTDEGNTATAENEFCRLVKSKLVSSSHVVVFCPRGVGLNAWSGDERKQIQIRRRFQLIGKTVDTTRVWDIRQAINMLCGLSADDCDLSLSATGTNGWLSLVAATFQNGVSAVSVSGMDLSRNQLPVFLGQMRVVSAEELFMLAAVCCPVEIIDSSPELVRLQRLLAEGV